MSIPTDFNLHREIINNLLRIDLHGRINLASFRNKIIDEINRMERELAQISEPNLFSIRFRIRISLLKQLENWIQHRILSIQFRI